MTAQTHTGVCTNTGVCSGNKDGEGDKGDGGCRVNGKRDINSQEQKQKMTGEIRREIQQQQQPWERWSVDRETRGVVRGSFTISNGREWIDCGELRRE